MDVTLTGGPAAATGQPPAAAPQGSPTGQDERFAQLLAAAQVFTAMSPGAPGAAGGALFEGQPLAEAELRGGDPAMQRERAGGPVPPEICLTALPWLPEVPLPVLREPGLHWDKVDPATALEDDARDPGALDATGEAGTAAHATPGHGAADATAIASVGAPPPIVWGGSHDSSGTPDVPPHGGPQSPAAREPRDRGAALTRPHSHGGGFGARSEAVGSRALPEVTTQQPDGVAPPVPEPTGARMADDGSQTGRSPLEWRVPKDAAAGGVEHAAPAAVEVSLKPGADAASARAIVPPPFESPALSPRARRGEPWTLEPAPLERRNGAVSPRPAVVPPAPPAAPADIPRVAAPAEAPVPGNADSPAPALQLVAALRVLAREGGGQARVLLRPEHLGPVTIEVSVRDDSVSAVMHVQRADVRAQIDAHLPTLRQQLEEHGLHLRELVVRDDEQPRRQQQERPAPRRPARPRGEDAPAFSVLA